MASTDEELDGMIIEFFETLNSIWETRDQLNNHLKSGYLMMSRARYSSGARAISPLQYSKDTMMAIVKVVNNSEDKYAPFLCKRLDTDIAQMNTGSLDYDLLINGIAKDGLRKRIVHSVDASDKDKENDEDIAESIAEDFEMLEIDKSTTCAESALSETLESSENITTDPINWFGLLVPESLKRCQAEFKQATMLSVKLVNLQTRLTLLQEDFRKLKGEHACHTAK